MSTDYLCSRYRYSISNRNKLVMSFNSKWSRLHGSRGPGFESLSHLKRSRLRIPISPKEVHGLILSHRKRSRVRTLSRPIPAQEVQGSKPYLTKRGPGFKSISPKKVQRSNPYLTTSGPGTRVRIPISPQEDHGSNPSHQKRTRVRIHLTKRGPGFESLSRLKRSRVSDPISPQVFLSCLCCSINRQVKWCVIPSLYSYKQTIVKVAGHVAVSE